MFLRINCSMSCMFSAPILFSISFGERTDCVGRASAFGDPGLVCFNIETKFFGGAKRVVITNFLRRSCTGICFVFNNYDVILGLTLFTDASQLNF